MGAFKDGRQSRRFCSAKEMDKSKVKKYMALTTAHFIK